jgi:hypothetical protein
MAPSHREEVRIMGTKSHHQSPTAALGTQDPGAVFPGEVLGHLGKS